jgi:hypothetical protein
MSVAGEAGSGPLLPAVPCQHHPAQQRYLNQQITRLQAPRETAR